jgi:hypothetical protein
VPAVTVRARVLHFAFRHSHTGERKDQLVEVAAWHVASRLEYLERATAEAMAAEDAFVTSRRREDEHSAALGEGPQPIVGEHLKAYNEARRAHRLLEYRVDTLYVFARILLDDVAALLHATLPVSQGRQIGATHKGVSKNLGAVATGEGLTGFESILTQADFLTSLVKDFRDDHIVHVSSKNPRAVRGVTMPPEGGARLSVGGLNYQREGEEIPRVTTEEPGELLVQLEHYIGVVLDFLEPLAPSLSANLPSVEELDAILESERE